MPPDGDSEKGKLLSHLRENSRGNSREQAREHSRTFPREKVSDFNGLIFEMHEEDRERENYQKFGVRNYLIYVVKIKNK